METARLCFFALRLCSTEYHGLTLLGARCRQ